MRIQPAEPLPSAVGDSELYKTPVNLRPVFTMPSIPAPQTKRQNDQSK